MILMTGLQSKVTVAEIRKLLNNYFRYLATTQMEPTGARLMVPCFDEPSFKAIWRVRIIHPKGTNAISNALEEQQNQPIT